MRKLLLTLIGVIFIISTFGQSYIGCTKKEVLEGIKNEALKIEKSETESDGAYYITAKFQNNTNQYSFTKDDICFFYILIGNYYFENYLSTCNYFDERYLRAIDDPCTTAKKSDIWKEPKGESFIYRWIIYNMNTGIQYTLVLPKENYDLNKYTYLQKLLSK